MLPPYRAPSDTLLFLCLFEESLLYAFCVYKFLMVVLACFRQNGVLLQGVIMQLTILLVVEAMMLLVGAHIVSAGM